MKKVFLSRTKELKFDNLKELKHGEIYWYSNNNPGSSQARILFRKKPKEARLFEYEVLYFDLPLEQTMQTLRYLKLYSGDDYYVSK